MLLVQPSGVKHLLGQLMLPELGVNDDSIAIRRLVCRVDRFDLLKGGHRLIVPAHTELRHPQVIQSRQIVRIDPGRLLIRLGRLFEPAHFVQDQPHIKEPGRIVGIDLRRQLQLAKRVVPFALLEEALRLFDAMFGLAPIVHVKLPASKLWSENTVRNVATASQPRQAPRALFE